MRDSGRWAEALAAFDEARAEARAIADAHPAITGFQYDLATIHLNRGNLLLWMARTAEALEAYKEARAIFRALADANPAVTSFAFGLADAHTSMGALLNDYAGRPAEALEAFRSAQSIYRALAGANPSMTKYQSALANSHFNVGNSLRALGRLGEAVESHRAALAVLRVLVDAHPDVPEYAKELAVNHTNLGFLLKALGRPGEASEAQEAARAILARLAREHPGSPAYAHSLGIALHGLGSLEFAARRLEGARLRFQEGADWQRKALALSPASRAFRIHLVHSLEAVVLVARALGDEAGAAQAERELADLRAADPAMAALDARLAAAASAGQPPKHGAERLSLARRAYDKALHAASARLWAEALDADPGLGEDRRAQNRYNAACAAALAAAGRGKDDPPPDAAARARLRARALDWLKSERAAWARVLDAGGEPARAAVRRSLRHWRSDPDLAGVRDPDALAELPEAERDAWRALWADVDRTLRDAAFPADPFAR
jgi:tetratricopeptide (TPR) repeat protein